MPPDDSNPVPELDRQRIDGSPLIGRAVELLTGLLGTSSPLLGFGVDACDVAEFRRQLKLSSAARFLANSFTEHELDYCAGRTERIAARWAAKEAVAKAVGTGFRGLKPSQIEIRRDRGGAPSLHPVGSQPWPHDAHTWSWLVSLGHESDLAVAAAIALRTGADASMLQHDDRNASQP